MKIYYFAWVRERVGKTKENLHPPSSISNVSELVDWLIPQGENYEFAFEERGKIRVAVNQDHVDWEHPIKQDDEIGFFPPVTGG